MVVFTECEMFCLRALSIFANKFCGADEIAAIAAAAQLCADRCSCSRRRCCRRLADQINSLSSSIASHHAGRSEANARCTRGFIIIMVQPQQNRPTLAACCCPVPASVSHSVGAQLHCYSLHLAQSVLTIESPVCCCACCVCVTIQVRAAGCVCAHCACT